MNKSKNFISDNNASRLLLSAGAIEDDSFFVSLTFQMGGTWELQITRRIMFRIIFILRHSVGIELLHNGLWNELTSHHKPHAYKLF